MRPARWPTPTELSTTVYGVRSGGEQRTCACCGATFVTVPYGHARRWCSKRCYWRDLNSLRRSTPEGSEAHREESRLYRVRERARCG